MKRVKTRLFRRENLVPAGIGYKVISKIVRSGTVPRIERIARFIKRKVDAI